MPPFDLWITLLTIALVMGVVLNTVAYLILLERWLSAWMQDRIGPNRVGPWGLLQPIVDGIKMFLKEDITPSHVDKLFFLLAPGIAASTALLAFVVVPFGPTVPPPLPQANIADYQQAQTQYEEAFKAGDRCAIAPGLDIGILLTFSITSLAVYGIILGGWSSNNKYSLMGSLRSSAQLISYEIPLGMSILGIVLYSGSLNLERIIDDQVVHGWNILYQPLAFVLFLTAAFAECNRLPFDLPECESELVGGYHTEYSSMKFGLFFLGEYTHMITTSYLCSAVFLGGWHIPFLEVGGWLGWGLKVAFFAFKVSLFINFFMLIRWTIPRFRFDQLMGLAWRVMIPLATVNLLGVMFVREFGGALPYQRWLLTGMSLVLIVAAGAFELRQAPPRRRR